MRLFFLRNLRLRLIASLCIAIAPVVIIGATILVKQYRDADSKIQQEALHYVRISGREYSYLIQNTRNFLALLASNQEVANGNAAASSALFAEQKRQHPYFSNISSFHPDGRWIASALPIVDSTPVMDRSWFKQVVETRGFSVGTFQIGSLSGKPNIGAGFPLYDDEGNLRVVLYAGIDLSWFHELAFRLDLRDGWILTLTDASGTVLSRYPNGEKWVGKSFGQSPELKAMRDSLGEGVAKSTDADGVEQMYAFTNLRRAPDGGDVHLSIGVPLSIAYSDLRDSLLFYILLLGLTVLLAFSGMALGSHLFILPTIDVLTETTKQLCSGNLGVRTGLPYTGGELGELAMAFDKMAESLESQESERERSRAALAQSEHRFRTIFDSVNDMILVLDPATGVVQDANPRICELSGYTREELLGIELFGFSSGKDAFTRENAMLWLEKAGTGEPQVFEWQIRSKNGRLYWAEVHLRSARIGETDSMLLTARDITQRKETELALRESESRYRAFIENSSEGIFRIELAVPLLLSLPDEEVIEQFYSSGYIAECNDEMAKIHGMGTATDMIGMGISEIFPKSDPRNMDFLSGFVRSGFRLVQAESYGKSMNGEDICVSSNLVGIVEEGRLVRAWGVQREITMQKKADEKLKDLFRFNQEIIASARNGIIVYDKNLKHVIWNRFMEEITGLSAEATVGKGALDLFPFLRDQGFEQLIRRALAGENCRSGDIYFVVPQTEREIWIMANAGPQFNTRGEVTGAIAIITDISDRKKSMAELERLSRRNQLILNAAGEGIIGMDRDGRCTFANPSSAEMLGRRVDEMIGKKVHQLIHHSRRDGSPYPASECPMHKTLKDGTHCRIRDEVLWKANGISFPAVYSSTPIVENGGITGAVITFRDATERKKAEEARKKLEEQLRQAQKMEAIGTLAGGIAHDFNNILTPIMGYCELSLQEIDQNSSLYKKIDLVLKSSIRAKDLVNQILTFSRKSDYEVRPVQIGTILSEVLGFLRSSLPSTVIIRRRIEPEAMNARLLADATRLHQILINLCTNAAHAMGEKGGILGVSLSIHDIGSQPGRTDLSPGKHLKLSISDTGHGIEKELQSRIFEPYFTTKASGEGTGLGLAMVYGIVKSLGGAISVSSKPGQGAVFDVLLPLVAGMPEAAPAATPNLPVGHGRILLVDDETAIVDLEREMVEHLGYEGTVRYGSLDALATFRANPHYFDLITTDQTMPQMTGSEFAEEALRIRPEIPIILCTGFSESVDEKKARSMGIKGFLMKPILLHSLASAIRSTLEGDEAKSD